MSRYVNVAIFKKLYFLVYNTINYRSTHPYEENVNPKEPNAPVYDPAELLLIERARSLQQKGRDLVAKISGKIERGLPEYLDFRHGVGRRIQFPASRPYHSVDTRY